jgi:hypothetical protein
MKMKKKNSPTEYFELMLLLESILKIRNKKKPMQLFIPAFKIYIANEAHFLREVKRSDK